MLRLIGSGDEVVAAIDDFRGSYHADYARARDIAKSYLSEPPSLASAAALSEVMYQVLGNWGAGSRKAPIRRSPADTGLRLLNPGLHNRLNKLAGDASSGLRLGPQGARVLTPTSLFNDLKSFDHDLLHTLAELAEAFFENNTNVTYPTKTLLLITGLAPAWDSQVRKGLRRSGMKGVSGTQFLLPADSSRALGQRVCRLPFSVASCWNHNQHLLQEAISQSNHPALCSEPGRVFDILFFMQQDLRRPQTLTFQNR